jgi:streptogramin lyase
VNEVSTVAAAYAMAGFATDATHVASSGTTLAQIGIANAFANSANLSNITSGAALTTTPAGNGTVPQSLIDTLANILAACVGSTGAAPTSTSSACSTVFANATADGTTTGAQPTETATAAINIAHHPGVSVAALFALSVNSPPFSPSLTAPPNDFSLALSFTAGGLVQGPTGIAIDGSGNVWVTNNSSNSVTELSSVGAPLSPFSGYTGGGLQGPIGIAIDDSGNVWVANRSGNSITELSKSGAPVSPSTGFIGGGLTSPLSIAIDPSGNVWAIEGGNAANETVIAELSNAGVPISPPTGFSSAAQLTPTYVAIDPASNLWLETERNSIAEVSSSGTLVGNNNVFQGGAQCNQADEIGGIAIDALGNKWSKSAFGVTKFSTSPSPICEQIGSSGGVDFQNWIGADSTPGAIAIDGSGNVWDLNVGNISEISNSLVPTSPLNGYQPLGLPTPVSIAIDGSGNVWLSGGNSVSELIGTSTPVVTPLATGVKDNALGSRP